VSRRRARSHAAVGHRPPPPRRLPDEEPSLRDQIATKFVPAAGLLPLRLFFGATFLYAGLDKLTTSTFFDPSSAASIQSQMAAFARSSPIGGLVRLGEPFAVAIGLVIALAEIAVGLGALSGLAFRLAAFGGAGLSLLFWLTASWSTHPYYYGPDLPYAVGWIALGLAGHGGFLVSRRFLEEGDAQTPGRVADRAHPDVVPSPERRAIIQAALLGGAAIAVASLAVPLRLLGSTSGASGALDGPLPSDDVGLGGSPGASLGAGKSTSAPSTIPVVGDVAIATVAAVQRTGAVAFTVPFSAAAPLPAGDPGIVVRLSDGSYVAFDAVCTHAGCTVEWDAPDKVLYCPCHGAAFDPANNAAVLGGPTNQPLASLPIVVDAASGKIFLRGQA
jgi:thiosulfate dehydrogenase [quinone] large subunit